MVWNYLVTAWRNLARHRLYGFINIAGLAVGLACAILIILFLIGATELFHNFLLFKGKERDPHFYFTLVNIALCGYCLIVIATAP